MPSSSTAHSQSSAASTASRYGASVVDLAAAARRPGRAAPRPRPPAARARPRRRRVAPSSRAQRGPPRPRRPRSGPPPAPPPPRSRRQWWHSIQTLVACIRAARSRDDRLPCSSSIAISTAAGSSTSCRTRLPRVTIGRRPSCDVALPWDDEVSRVHAELVRMGERLGRPRRRALAQRHVRQRRARAHGRRRLRGRRRDPGRPHADLGVRGRARLDGGADPRAREPGDRRRSRLTPAQRRLLEALCRPLRESPVPRAGVQPRDRGRADDLASTPSRARSRRCSSASS